MNFHLEKCGLSYYLTCRYLLLTTTFLKFIFFCKSFYQLREHSFFPHKNHFYWNHNPADIYLFKVSNRNTKAISGISPKLRTKRSERCHLHNSDVFNISFELNSHLLLVFWLLTLNLRWKKCTTLSITVVSWLLNLKK